MPRACIDEAVALFGSFASGLANVIAFATNAGIAPLALYVGLDASAGLLTRQFVQEFGQFDSGPIQQGRAIPVDETRLLCSDACHLGRRLVAERLDCRTSSVRWRRGYPMSGGRTPARRGS